jgi:tRNA (guanosine-2'-O-)-methyltransferase
MKERKIHPDNAILAELDQLVDTRQERLKTVVAQRQRGLMVLMEHVNNPFNLAAISRSCDAFGVQTIAYTIAPEHQFDPYTSGSPAAMSSSKWLDYRSFTAGTDTALTTLKTEGWHLIATTLSESAYSLYEMDFTPYPQIALLVGDERNGLSQTALNMADTHLTIPMLGMIQSFNVSVATAIILFEIVRQRRASGQEVMLPDDEQERLFHQFVRRSLAR